MRSTFTSGAWVEHTPIQELKGKHRRGLDRASRPQPIYRDGELDREATMSGFDVLSWQDAKRDAVWAMVINSWSYQLPQPAFDYATGETTNADSFEEVPIDDLDELEALMAPFEAKLQHKPDPKGAITSGSNGSSRESAAASPTA